jgi:hypothetical protein
MGVNSRFGTNFASSLIRICIQKPDPAQDPEDKVNADPDPQHYVM